MLIKDSKISERRLERYIDEKLEDVIQKIQDGACVEPYVLWGIDILEIYNQGMKEVKEKGVDDLEESKRYAARYTRGYCLGVMAVKLEVFGGGFGTEVIENISFEDSFGMTAIELNEIFLYMNTTSSMDAITNGAGIFRDMELVEFGTIKAYLGLVEDGLLSMELIAERMGVTTEEIARIMKVGVLNR